MTEETLWAVMVHAGSVDALKRHLRSGSFDLHLSKEYKPIFVKDTGHVLCALSGDHYHEHSYNLDMIDFKVIQHTGTWQRVWPKREENPFSLATALHGKSHPKVNRWESFGPTLIVDDGQLCPESLADAAFLDSVCKFSKSRWILLRSRIQPDQLRSPRMQIIHNTNNDHTLSNDQTMPVASTKINGLQYIWYPMHSMFCPGNVSEKLRVSRQLKCSGETVLDLFAGIGYWTIPILAHGGARHVYAVDLNPASLAALEQNLRLNGISSDRCTIIQGDNRLVEAVWRGLCDRVVLGLIPTARDSWKVAMEALRLDRGGWLHVHENVEMGQEEQFQEDLLDFIRKFSPAAFHPSIMHRERVKSYAPRIYHWVFDVKIEAKVVCS